MDINIVVLIHSFIAVSFVLSSVPDPTPTPGLGARGQSREVVVLP